jgi:glycosyltransferase involved in cell wall biosynthesis
MDDCRQPDSFPVVSIIVPARNEEACLALCVESLLTQTGIAFEVIVVDDASSDRTAEIARSFANVTVISAPPLPDNWTGKNNAMAAGANVAHTKAKWLLFTDADTVHKPGSLARAVAEAEQHGAALLSYSPEQEVRGLWEKAIMPVIFAELAATYPPKKVNDPASPIAAANGQYLLISREAYDAVGGHTTIASDLLEDVAMARLVKSSGRRIFFRCGGDAVRTRMYRSWAQMKEGWTKNLALLVPKPRALALLRSTEFVLIIGNLVAAIWGKFSGRPNLALQTALLTLILTGWFWMRIRKAHFPPLSSLMALFGLPVFSYLLLRSASLHGAAGIVWKDRTYEPSPHSLSFK